MTSGSKQNKWASRTWTVSPALQRIDDALRYCKPGLSLPQSIAIGTVMAMISVPFRRIKFQKLQAKYQAKADDTIRILLMPLNAPPPKPEPSDLHDSPDGGSISTSQAS